MPPNPKVAKAFRAMKNLGIKEEKVKPVLKKLLKLYDKKWELIEEENYRALADAIFESEETQVTEKNTNEHPMQEEMEEEAQPPEEADRPLKRLRRHVDSQASPSFCNSDSTLVETISEKPTLKDVQSPQGHLDHQLGEAAALNRPNVEGSGVGDRGKTPISPDISTGKTRSSESSSQAVGLKRLRVENNIAISTKQKLKSSQSLIRPKDEPFTDDMPHFEAPIAAIHPDSPCKGNFSVVHNSPREQDVPKLLASSFANGEDNRADVPLSSSDRKGNCKLDVASSSLGEVKLSFTFNSVLERPGFQSPNVDAVLKMVEDRCLRSYKILDPNFSLMKLMEDMCNCFLELGTDAGNKSGESIDTTIAVSLLEKTSLLVGFTNGVHFPCENEVTLPQTPRLPLHCNRSDFNGIQNFCEKDGENEHDLLNSHSLLVVQQHELTPENIRSLHDASDLSKGQESIAISLIYDGEFPPSFQYIPHNVVFQKAQVSFTLASVKDDTCCSTCVGNCLLSSTPCVCAYETGGEFAYTLDGVVREDYLEECVSVNRDRQKHHLHYCKKCPIERVKNDENLEPCKGHLPRKFIKECWYKCGCSKHCGNRVVQRGMKYNLQVFMTSKEKGWGLRTLEDLPKGAFVCEYVGEVLTNVELYNRIAGSFGLGEHSCPVLLDADWGSEEVIRDEEALCLDATYYGNIARFINHRCGDSSLVEIPVEVETPNHHYYHLALFTTRKVEAMEELTWDYGIDFDDPGHCAKAFQCCCGSKFCRNMRRSIRSISAAAIEGER